MAYDFPSNKSSNPLSRYGFWLIIVCAVLIVVGTMGYNNTNHDPDAIPNPASAQPAPVSGSNPN